MLKQRKENFMAGYRAVGLLHWTRDPVIFFLWFQPNNAMYEESHKWFMLIWLSGRVWIRLPLWPPELQQTKIIPRGLLTINDICHVPQIWKDGIVRLHREKSTVCLLKKGKKIMLMKVLQVWYRYIFLTLGFMLYSLLKIHCKLQSKPFCYMIYITDVHTNLWKKNKTLGMLVLQKKIAFRNILLYLTYHNFEKRKKRKKEKKVFENVRISLLEFLLQ